MAQPRKTCSLGRFRRMLPPKADMAVERLPTIQSPEIDVALSGIYSSPSVDAGVSVASASEDDELRLVRDILDCLVDSVVKTFDSSWLKVNTLLAVDPSSPFSLSCLQSGRARSSSRENCSRRTVRSRHTSSRAHKSRSKSQGLSTQTEGSVITWYMSQQGVQSSTAKCFQTAVDHHFPDEFNFSLPDSALLSGCKIDQVHEPEPVVVCPVIKAIVTSLIDSVCWLNGSMLTDLVPQDYVDDSLNCDHVQEFEFQDPNCVGRVVADTSWVSSCQHNDDNRWNQIRFGSARVHYCGKCFELSKQFKSDHKSKDSTHLPTTQNQMPRLRFTQFDSVDEKVIPTGSLEESINIIEPLKLCGLPLLFLANVLSMLTLDDLLQVRGVCKLLHVAYDLAWTRMPKLKLRKHLKHFFPDSIEGLFCTTSRLKEALQKLLHFHSAEIISFDLSFIHLNKSTFPSIIFGAECLLDCFMEDDKWYDVFHLNLRHCSVTKRVLDSVFKFKNLRSLSFSTNRIELSQSEIMQMLSVNCDEVRLKLFNEKAEINDVFNDDELLKVVESKLSKRLTRWCLAKQTSNTKLKCVLAIFGSHLPNLIHLSFYNEKKIIV